ncbi:TIGR02391 family protein [Brachybacterium sp. UNK5269]|uniref:TIGR02391 family protein n=1 Tax=Brachybacterium sp. UNK5269 TaxID=3408576 RepID=UPI003BB145CF
MNSSDNAPNLDGPTTDEIDQLAARLPVTRAAWAFLEPFYEQADLISAWPMVDPQLRLCWAQWWISANEAALEAEGYSREEVADAFVRQAGAHPLWEQFERVVLRDFRAAMPLHPDTWGIGAAERVIDSSTEVLYVLRNIPANGVWQPGESQETVPLVMRHSAGRWRLLNLGYEQVPEPGWPPALWGPPRPSRLSAAPPASQQTRQNDDPHGAAVARQPDDGWVRSHLERFIDMTSLVEPPSTRSISRNGRDSRRMKAPLDEIVSATVLIERILEQVTPTWRKDVPEDLGGRWQQHRDAALRAIAALDLHPEIQARLGEAPTGSPASLLHPWVWDAARQLWSGAFFAEAVGAAARRVNAKTQQKVDRKDVADTDLFKQAFSTALPAEGRPRLRLWEDDGSQTYRNVHRGAMALAEGLFASARNLAAHEDDYELTEKEALEQLVAFSLLARWVERSRKITE